MRNLKRALSLVLASVMVLGLMIVGSNAMTADFGDADQIDPQYTEAIDVLTTIGLIDGMGDEANSFNPVGTLRRNEAAKLLSVMLLGEDNANKLSKNSEIFTDVPAGNWAAGYIAYCDSVGILDGNGDGTFLPEGLLTGVQFGKMLLVALGYDADIEQYVNAGAAWQVNVASDMIEAGIDVADISFSDPITREQAAQMVLNTLEAPMVKYVSNNNVTSREYLTTTIAKTQTISSLKLTNTNNYTIEFAEKYFTDLKYDGGNDTFGRPNYTWQWKNVEIDSYVDESQLIAQYSTKVTGAQLYDLLGKSVVDNIKKGTISLRVFIDGDSSPKADPSGAVTIDNGYFGIAEISNDNKDAVGRTGNGVLTQVFQDSSNDQITIVVINTYLAKASADYNKTTNQASFNVFGIKKYSSGTTSNYIKTQNYGAEDKLASVTISADDFWMAVDVKKDDIYKVNVVDGEIKVITPIDAIKEASISSFSKYSNIKVEGQTYNYANSAEYNYEVLDDYTVTGAANLKDTSYNVYLDDYGYVLGVDIAAKADNYVFITGIDQSFNSISNTTASANAIFIDGTIKTIDINLRESYKNTETNTQAALNVSNTTNGALVNSWFTYTLGNDGLYTLKAVYDAKNAGSNDYIFNSGTNTGKASKIAQYRYVNSGADVIDNKHITLPGRDSGHTINEFKKVYGNKDSVYINVTLQTIEYSSNNFAAVINDVDSVVTGIANANFELKINTDAMADANDEGNYTVAGTGCTNPNNVSYGTYTLYKDNGYIIASIVVAEESYSSKQVVYVHDNQINESYDSSKDEWTWTRNIIINGNESGITEIGNSISELKKMEKGKWYLVKYKADGTVKNADEVKGIGDGSKDGSIGYASTIDKVYYLENDASVKTILYENTNQGKPKFVGNTFYIDNGDTRGFTVSDEVKLVFIQTNDGVETTSFEVGSDSLKDIIDRLIDNSGYEYKIGAIIEDSYATTIVIEDLKTKAPSSSGAGAGTTYTAKVTDIDTASTTITVKITGTPPTNYIKTVVGQALETSGYHVRYWSSYYLEVTATRNGEETTFDVNLVN